MSNSPFPKLSQVWRAVRLAAVTFGTTSLAGLAHVAWADRTAIAAVAVGAAEAAYRQALPSGVASGRLATLIAAYRQITEAAKPADPAPAPAPVARAPVVVPISAPEPAPAGTAEPAPAAPAPAQPAA